MTESPKNELSVAELRQEARRLRQEKRTAGPGGPLRLSPVGRLLLSVICVGLVGVATYLLVNPAARNPVTEVLAEQVARRLDPAEQLFVLPPPPPKPVLQKVAAPSSPIVYTQKDFDGVLYATEYGVTIEPPKAAGRTEATAPTAPEELPKSQEAESAFALLGERVTAMGEVSAGSREDFKLTGWSVLKSNPPTFLIDVVVVRAGDSREVHLVWDVNLESGAVKAMSQAARDLAALESRK